MAFRSVRIVLRKTNQDRLFSLPEHVQIDSRVCVFLETDSSQQRAVREHDLNIRFMLFRPRPIGRGGQRKTPSAPYLKKAAARLVQFALKSGEDLCDLIRSVGVTRRVGEIPKKAEHGDQLVDTSVCQPPKTIGFCLLHAVPPISLKCSR